MPTELKDLSVKELREKRGVIVKQMQELVARERLDDRGKEDRGMSPEDQELFNRMDVEQQAIKDEMDARAKKATDDCQARAKALADEHRCHEPQQTCGTDQRRCNDGGGDEQRGDFGRALRGWLLTPSGHETDEDRGHMQRCGLSPHAKLLRFNMPNNYEQPNTIEEARERRDVLRHRTPEQRAQSVGTTTAGGYAVPDEMMAAIDIALLQFGAMLNVATIMPTRTGADLPIPTTNDTAQTGEIIAENTTANEQDVTFGQLVLQAFKYSSKMVKVSYELLQDSATPIPTLLGRLLGERIGRILNTHFTTGDASSKPNGIVTAAADSSITGAAAQWTWQEILQLKHSVDPAYRLNASFMGNDTTLRLMKTIVDDNSRPIWLPNLTAGEPDRFDGDPFVVNPQMASTAGAKSLLYGDMSKYICRRVLEFNLLRLDERYAELAQVAFLGWARWDGDLLDAGTNPVKYATSYSA